MKNDKMWESYEEYLKVAHKDIAKRIRKARPNRVNIQVLTKEEWEKSHKERELRAERKQLTAEIEAGKKAYEKSVRKAASKSDEYRDFISFEEAVERNKERIKQIDNILAGTDVDLAFVDDLDFFIGDLEDKTK